MCMASRTAWRTAFGDLPSGLGLTSFRTTTSLITFCAEFRLSPQNAIALEFPRSDGRHRGRSKDRRRTSRDGWRLDKTRADLPG
jgi:hypothetical protein